MPTPAIPILQQNALPIQSISAAVTPDQVTIVNGQVQKYWGPGAMGATPTGTGMNGQTRTVTGSAIYCFTNFVDLSGCSICTAQLSRFNNSAFSLGAFNWNLWAQYRLTPTTIMPVQNLLGGGAANLDQCGMFLINTSVVAFPAMPQGSTTFIQVSWGPSSDTGTSSVVTPVTIGPDVRFFIEFSATPSVDNLFSMALWGSS